MAYSFNPSIVTNGLLMNFDAASLKSYSGSGTTWTDISGNAITATLQNSGSGTVSFADGVVVFAAVDAAGSAGHYLINSAAITSLTTQSIECWFKVNNFYTSSGRTMAIPFGARTFEGNQPIGFDLRSDGTIGYSINASGVWYTGNTASGYADTTKWMCISQTVDDVTKEEKTYYNGDFVATLTYTGTPTSMSGFLFGRGFYGGTLNYSGKIGITRCYNRALTSSEVKQNFNAMKGRFGL